MRWMLAITFSFGLTACVGIPEGIKPVSEFELDRYLGKWFEIARLDHSFERDLTHVTAYYEKRDDGAIRVINRGFSLKSGLWKQAEGKALFVNKETDGFLKVSFFGPFYGSYVIFELDKQNYRYALISGPDKSYLWLLARDPGLSVEERDKLVAIAKNSGFDTSRLIFVDHD